MATWEAQTIQFSDANVAVLVDATTFYTQTIFSLIHGEHLMTSGFTYAGVFLYCCSEAQNY